MALGPKAMGEDILANLKGKTAKDLGEWQAALEASGITEPAAARQHLQDLGLGTFQARALVEHVLSADPYADARRLVDDQFARFPEQRDAPKMLHLAEQKLAATLPFGKGKLTPVPSGLPYMVEVDDVPQPDGSVTRVMSLLGVSPKHLGEPTSLAGTGLFGVVRGRATPEVREAVAAAIDSLAPR